MIFLQVSENRLERARVEARQSTGHYAQVQAEHNGLGGFLDKRQEQ